MAKFQQNPTFVEAEQWFPGKEVPGVQAPIEGLLSRHHVKTPSGQICYVEPGDWVIALPDGRGYLRCPADIFAANHTPVGE